MRLVEVSFKWLYTDTQRSFNTQMYCIGTKISVLSMEVFLIQTLLYKKKVLLYFLAICNYSFSSLFKSMQIHMHCTKLVYSINSQSPFRIQCHYQQDGLHRVYHQMIHSGCVIIWLHIPNRSYFIFNIFQMLKTNCLLFSCLVPEGIKISFLGGATTCLYGLSVSFVSLIKCLKMAFKQICFGKMKK